MFALDTTSEGEQQFELHEWAQKNLSISGQQKLKQANFTTWNSVLSLASEYGIDEVIEEIEFEKKIDKGRIKRVIQQKLMPESSTYITKQKQRISEQIIFVQSALNTMQQIYIMKHDEIEQSFDKIAEILQHQKNSMISGVNQIVTENKSQLKKQLISLQKYHNNFQEESVINDKLFNNKADIENKNKMILSYNFDIQNIATEIRNLGYIGYINAPFIDIENTFDHKVDVNIQAAMCPFDKLQQYEVCHSKIDNMNYDEKSRELTHFILQSNRREQKHVISKLLSNSKYRIRVRCKYAKYGWTSFSKEVEFQTCKKKVNFDTFQWNMDKYGLGVKFEDNNRIIAHSGWSTVVSNVVISKDICNICEWEITSHKMEHNQLFIGFINAPLHKNISDFNKNHIGFDALHSKNQLAVFVNSYCKFFTLYGMNHNGSKLKTASDTLFKRQPLYIFQDHDRFKIVFDFQKGYALFYYNDNYVNIICSTLNVNGIIPAVSLDDGDDISCTKWILK